MAFLLLFLMSFFIAEDASVLQVTDMSVYDTFAIGKPMQKGEWNMTPTVKVCSETELSLFRVEKALKYWEKLGYEFAGVHMDSSFNCSKARYGQIVISLPDGTMGNSRLASTRLYTEKQTGHIIQAKIFVYPHFARKARVIEHELGHALGWSHHSQKFHIMHPTWSMGGYDASGTRKR